MINNKRFKKFTAISFYIVIVCLAILGVQLIQKLLYDIIYLIICLVACLAKYSINTAVQVPDDYEL